MTPIPPATQAANRRRARAVLWNLRFMGLLAIGPAAGVGLGAAIFGLPPDLQFAAGVMFLFGLGLCAILAKAEWRRLEQESEVRFGSDNP